MGYTNCINITDALWFDLFDEVPYKWLKEVLDKKMDWDEYDFEVEITDVPATRTGQQYCATKFKFDLRWNDETWFGEKKWKTKTFTKTIEYNGSSPVALKLCGMTDESDEEEEDEESLLIQAFEESL